VAKRTLFHYAENGSFGLYLAACALACVPAYAQFEREPNTENAEETTLRGCPTTGSDAVYFTATNGETYRLTGGTSLVKGYEDQEMLLQGTVEDSTQPHSSFHATKIKKVFEKPKPRLTSDFTDSSHWDSGSNLSYGVRFSYPGSFLSLTSDDSPRPANFVSANGVVALAALQMPRELYPGTNFVGGLFGIQANTVITNAESCSEFGFSEPENRSSFTVGGVKYSRTRSVDGGLGTGVIDHEFHTFQNGLCYEVWFEMAESWAYPLCGIAQLDDGDEMNLIEPLLSGITFVLPIVKVTAALPETPPAVTSFTATAQVADATNGGSISFLWTTDGTDYVELSYHCSRAGLGVLIHEDNAEAGCENASDPNRVPILANRSSSSSLKVNFSNYVGYGDDEDVPMSVVVTVTPFSHGKEYPNSRRSIAIEVEPTSPFRLNYGEIDITFPLNTDRTSYYQQGSTLTLEWTDPTTQDECVELYLVRNEDNVGKIFHARIVGGCLKPSSSGSYTWTIPEKYSGYGYRIFARAPGGSSGVSVPFTIVKKDHHTMPD